MSIEERFGDRGTGEGIRLDQYLLLCRRQFAYDGIGAPAIRGEVDTDSGRIPVLRSTTPSGRETTPEEGDSNGHLEGVVPEGMTHSPILFRSSPRRGSHRVVLLVAVWLCV
jgi:hypothetical protein